MGKKMQNTKTYLTTKKFTPMQIIVLVIAVLYAVFTETEFFNNLHWMWKLSIYIGLPVLALFLGVSLIDVKKVLNQMNLILSDKQMTTEEKVWAMLKLLSQIAFATGEMFEVFQEEQFRQIREVKNYDNEIAKLQEQIEKLNGEKNKKIIMD